MFFIFFNLVEICIVQYFIASNEFKLLFGDVVEGWAAGQIIQHCSFRPQIYLLTITYVTSSVVTAGDTVICKTRHGSWFHKTCDLEITTHIQQIIIHITNTYITITHITYTLITNYSEFLKRK